MISIQSLIKRNTGLKVEVLTNGHDNTSKVYYSCCCFGSVLCYVEIAENENHLIICTDDDVTLNNISKILKNQKNNNVVTCSTNETPYYMYKYMVKCATQ